MMLLNTDFTYSHTITILPDVHRRTISIALSIRQLGKLDQSNRLLIANSSMHGFLRTVLIWFVYGQEWVKQINTGIVAQLKVEIIKGITSLQVAPRSVSRVVMFPWKSTDAGCFKRLSS